MLDTAKELKERKAEKVVVCCTFGLFTAGFDKFDEFYQKGYIDSVVTTNLNYRSPELFTKEWYVEADMSKYIAAIINSLNHDVSIGNSLSPDRQDPEAHQKVQRGTSVILNFRKSFTPPGFYYGSQAALFSFIRKCGLWLAVRANWKKGGNPDTSAGIPAPSYIIAIFSFRSYVSPC